MTDHILMRNNGTATGASVSKNDDDSKEEQPTAAGWFNIGALLHPGTLKIALKSGVIGKHIALLMVAIVCVTAVALIHSELVAIIVVIGIFILTILGLLLLLNFASKNPAAATLEGASLERTLIAQMRSKDTPVITVDHEPVSDPALPPPHQARLSDSQTREDIISVSEAQIVTSLEDKSLNPESRGKEVLPEERKSSPEERQ